MDEYIKKKDALNIVQSLVDCDYDIHSAICDACNSIKSLPSAQQWIPYSERPPEEEGVYFVTFNKNCLLENELPVMDAIWRDGQWQYGVLESYAHRMPKLVIEPIEELKVIAWMPLSEPWKGEKA